MFVRFRICFDLFTFDGNMVVCINSIALATDPFFGNVWPCVALWPCVDPFMVALLQPTMEDHMVWFCRLLALPKEPGSAFLQQQCNRKRQVKQNAFYDNLHVLWHWVIRGCISTYFSIICYYFDTY